MRRRGWVWLLFSILLAGGGGWFSPSADARTGPGCLFCHQGIETINDRMEPFLLTFARKQFGRGEGYECSICHEGNPAFRSRKTAHRGLIPNPSSLWVLHRGKGCAKCHDGRGSIRTLMGKPLPAPVGGSLLSIHVLSSDPAGATGFDYTYRMARALMSLETGKANKILSSNGVIPKGTFPYADFNMDDPDGPVPRAGSDLYKAWVKKAIENRSFLRWESPILGVNLKGKISPLVPGCQVFYTLIGKDGKIKTLNRSFSTSDGHRGPTLAPLQPHSVTRVARTCEDCHTNPKTLGYGTANSRSAAKLLGDRPLFQDLSHGVYGDIPGAESGRQQVPAIQDFPYALDQLVTRSGKQVQNMPLPGDRPLNRKERNLVEREGLCIGCHQYSGSGGWARIVRKYGRAGTPEEHDRMVSRALRSLMQENRE